MLIDVHTHTQFAAFEKDYKEVIERALKAGVSIINVGTQRDTSRRAVKIAHEFSKDVYATVGLHPIHTERSYHDPQELGFLPQTNADNESRTNADSRADQHGKSQREPAPAGFTSRGEDFDYEYYRRLARDPKVVAMGECGLDYYRLTRTHADWTQTNADNLKNKQKETFLAQAELAKELDKSLMIHCRPSKGSDDAYEDLIALMSNVKFQMPKIVHFYVGSLAVTKKLIDANFYFTFGGVITFSRDYDEVIKYIPLDRILLETDAPYVAPEPYRGKRNEPAYVVEVVKKMAELKDMSQEKMEQQIFENTKRIFNLNL